MSNDLWIPAMAIAAIVVAAAAGVFNPRRLPGPRRLAPGEPVAAVFRILAIALAAWALTTVLIGSVHQLHLKRTHQPTTTELSDTEIIIYNDVLDLVVLGAVVSATVVTRPRGIEQIGLSPRRLPAGILWGVFAILIVLPLLIYVNAGTEWLLERLGKQNTPHEMLEILKNHPPAWLRIADVVAAGLIAPVAEECFFRGILQTGLRYLFNRPWLAILFSSAAFALVHQWWTWPQIFFLGFCLGYLYERTGNLWASITLHALFNLTSIFFFTHMG
jgi:membrane protease YdiL (CAAX protease family)